MKFFCALPPALKPAWSKRYSDILAEDGRLVCLEFPTYKASNLGGPPWSSPPEVYMAYLPRPGEQLIWDEESGVLMDKIGPASKNGLQRIEHFKPKRTHEAGYDEQGNVTDWVGIWAQPK